MPADTVYKLDNGKELVCSEVMRSLPEKRLVFAGEYAGSKVVAKLFLDPNKAERHWRRELDGLGVFTKCDIATAAVLYAGKTEAGGHPIIVLTQLEGLESVKRMWDEADDQVRERLLKRMTQLLARHHQAGLCQTDMHLDNFMFAAEEIYSLDGAGVRFYPKGVSEETACTNLALLIAQVTPEWESRVPQLYDLYVSERGWQHGPGSELLLEKIQEARAGRWKEFRNKLFRNCTAFSYTKYGDGFQVVSNKHSSGELLELLRNPDASFPGSENALKNGNTCTVWPATVGGTDLVVKRYNIKNFWHGLKLRLFPGRGERSWVNGHCLKFFGVPTPSPVALVKRRTGLFGTTYLFSEMELATSAKRWFRDPNVSIEEKRFMVEQIARIIRGMQRHRISHGDLKASNILIADDKAMVIDLDATRHHKTDFAFRRAWARDIRRFLQNWEDDEELCGLFVKSLKSHGVESPSLIMQQ